MYFKNNNNENKKSYYALSTKHNFISHKNKSKILPFLLATKYSARLGYLS